jgi:hypothetical protein
MTSNRPPFDIWCPYSADEAHKRIIQFFDVNKSSLKVESVTRNFLINQWDATASLSEARYSNYPIDIYGEGGWRIFAVIMEYYLPIDKGPPKFASGIYPKRLGRFENSVRHVQITFFFPPEENGEARSCRKEYSLLPTAESMGWEPPKLPSANFDRPSPLVQVVKGNRVAMISPPELMTNVQHETNCLEQIEFVEGPNT